METTRRGFFGALAGAVATAVGVIKAQPAPPRATANRTIDGYVPSGIARNSQADVVTNGDLCRESLRDAVREMDASDTLYVIPRALYRGSYELGEGQVYERN